MYRENDINACNDAEVAIWNEQGWITGKILDAVFDEECCPSNDCEPDGYGIASYVTADEVGKIIAYLMTL